MKKLALLIVGILIGFLICYYFVQQDKVVTESEQSPPAPKGLITSKQSMDLDKAYDDRYNAVNLYLETESGDDNFKDNRSSWYSLDDVEKYLAFAKAEAKDKGYEMNGIRIYLGAKSPESQQKFGFTTMFIVSTGKKVNAKGSMFNTSSYFQPSPPDIPGGSGLDDGGNGNPPNGNYPQQ